MFLTLLKRAVKAALHDAVDEWALESGLPRTVVEEARAKRLALTVEADARADAAAATALGVDDDDLHHHDVVHTALPMPSAARMTAPDVVDVCPAPGDELSLVIWIHRQRASEVGWSEIAKLAADAGHTLNEEALRSRHRRWREKAGQFDNNNTSHA